MLCLACRHLSGRDLCTGCRATLRPGPDRILGFGVVRSGFVHDAAARTLVHRLKYEAMGAAGRFLAREGMAHLVPAETRWLVPVPRVRWRTARYGVDPAIELAEALASLTGYRVVEPLRPAMLGARHAGRSRTDRKQPRFGVVAHNRTGMLLVDDVMTTGLTLDTAAARLGTGVIGAVAATVSV